MRVAIVGNSGSGKSTLAHRLVANSSIPMLDLDTIAWEPDQVAVPRVAESAHADLRNFCNSNEQWIVEGCYAGLVEAALSFDAHLIVLEPGLKQCISNCRARPWEPHKYSSKEEQDRKLSYLLNWVQEYYSRDGDMSLSAHRVIFERYEGPKEWLSEMPGLEFALSKLR